MATRVLIADGGVAALEAALALRDLAEHRVEVELLSPEPQFWYRPLAVAEPFDLGEVRQFELADLAAAAGATFSPGALVGVDAERRLATTSTGTSLEYDALLVACGAAPVTAVRGALTFRGPADTERFRQLLAEIVAGEVDRVAFAVPWGAVWSLPLYELALMTAAYLGERKVEGVELALVTPEDEPLQLFGRSRERGGARTARGAGDRRADACVRSRICGRRAPSRPRGAHLGRSRRRPAAATAADRRAAADARGLPVGRRARSGARPFGRLRRRRHHQLSGQAGRHRDAAGRRRGRDDRGDGRRGHHAAAVSAGAAWAAPDRTTAAVSPARADRRRRRCVGGQSRAALVAAGEDRRPLSRSVPRCDRGRRGATGATCCAGRAIPVEVELEETKVDRLAALRLEIARDAEAEEGATVGEVMSSEPLVVAPEDTLGEVSEKMRQRDVGSALVADYGRLIGILTSRDLLRAFAGRVHPSEARVREWMTAEPVTASAATPIEAAVTLMTEYGFHHMPVVEDERPVGMLGLGNARPAPGGAAGAQARRRAGIGLGF